MKHESDGDTNCNWRVQYSDQIIQTRTGVTRNKRMRRGHPNNSILDIGQNTENSPEDLRRLGVTQATGENHWQTLV